MEQEGNVYQDTNQVDQPSQNPEQQEQEQPPDQSAAQDVQPQGINQSSVSTGDDGTAVNKLFSLGIILLVVSIMITALYLFSVSDVIVRFSPNIDGFSLPY